MVNGEGYHKNNCNYAEKEHSTKSHVAHSTMLKGFPFEVVLFQPSYTTKCKIQKGDTIVIHSVYYLRTFEEGKSNDRYLFRLGRDTDYRGLQFFDKQTVRIYTHESQHFDFKWTGGDEGNHGNLVSIIMNLDLPDKASSLWINGKKVCSFDMTLPKGDIEEITWWNPATYDPNQNGWGGSYLLEMYHDNQRVREGCVYARSTQLVTENDLPHKP